MTARSLVGGDTAEPNPGRNCRVWVLWEVGNQKPEEGRSFQADTVVAHI